jgi:hypothetical protein
MGLAVAAPELYDGTVHAMSPEGAGHAEAMCRAQ